MVGSLEKNQEEASTVQVVQAAISGVSTTGTDHSRTSEQTENAKDDNTQIEAASKQAYLNLPAQALPRDGNNKRARCDDSEEMNDADSGIDFNAEAGNTAGGDAAVSCNERRDRKRKYAKFDERFDELREFKNKFGHCDVPIRYSENPALGQWVSTSRYAYNQIQKGTKPSTDLSNERIAAMENLGFKWTTNARAAFDRHFDELVEFKIKFGHCEVPKRNAEYPALGQWCCDMRCAYNRLQKGLKPGRGLGLERIERLEKIGFKWTSATSTTFDYRFDELTEFKNKFGHCDIPYTYHVNLPLGRWCSDIRYAYKRLQKGLKPAVDLSVDRIERLENLGFKWDVIINSRNAAFDKHCDDLIEFKNKFGHCDVPYFYPENNYLGNWCKKLGCAYNQMQNGEKPAMDLSGDRIQRLEKIGFKWKERIPLI